MGYRSLFGNCIFSLSLANVGNYIHTNAHMHVYTYVQIHMCKNAQAQIDV